LSRNVATRNEGDYAMQTIALISRKGGTGKSTLAIGLAIAAMEAGEKVCLLEADPLGTISNWHRRRSRAEPTVECVRDGYALTQCASLLERRGVTLTIIDTAGGWSDASTAAIGAADLCLIPARPSPADIEAAAPALRAIRAAGKPFAFVLNQTPARSYRLNDAAVSLGDTATSLNLAGVLALPYVVQRNDQQDALGAGLAVTEFARAGKSAAEVGALWQWVAARLATLSETRAELPATPPAEVAGIAVPADQAESIAADSEVDFDAAVPANVQDELRAAG
jgi:chromosome partitioning protein